jgi:hypothetical protein
MALYPHDLEGKKVEEAYFRKANTKQHVCDVWALDPDGNKIKIYSTKKRRGRLEIYRIGTSVIAQGEGERASDDCLHAYNFHADVVINDETPVSLDCFQAYVFSADAIVAMPPI